MTLQFAGKGSCNGEQQLKARRSGDSDIIWGAPRPARSSQTRQLRETTPRSAAGTASSFARRAAPDHLESAARDGKRAFFDGEAFFHRVS